MKVRIRQAPVGQSLVAALLALAIAVSGLAGCAGSASIETTVNAGEGWSDRPRRPAGSAAGNAVPALVAGNTEFALDLYSALFEDDENLIFSPHSLSVVLAMTYAGARGETEQQMARALHLGLPQAQLHAAFNALDQTLSGRDQGVSPELQLRFVQALWGQEGETFLEPFLDTLAEYYGAGMQLVDFQRAEEARRMINEWASAQTENQIGELLPPGALDSATALVLANAATFQAAWEKPFPEDATREAAFTLLQGGRVLVPMMEQVAEWGYAELPGVQAVELPYAGGELSMVVLLPNEGNFEPFARSLDAGQLQTILGALAPTNVRLALPRFRTDAGYELRDALTGLGMADAFGEEADFSGIDGTQELFIEQVYHQAFIEVDEAGSEAAAAAAVAIARKGAPQAEREIRVDRPFLFLIRDIDTSALLFLGHVVNPSP